MGCCSTVRSFFLFGLNYHSVFTHQRGEGGVGEGALVQGATLIGAQGGLEDIRVVAHDAQGLGYHVLAVGEKLHKLLERGLAQGREKQAGRRNVTGDKGLAVGSLLRQRGQAAAIVCRLIKNAVLF